MNFILYEDEEVYVSSYVEVITKLMGQSKVDYEIHKINKYDKKETMKYLDKITGRKIYIFDVEVSGKNGIDLARKIRNRGDWSSPMILVTSHDEFKVVGFTGKILMLDFIRKDKDLKNNLTEALKLALDILEIRPRYNFSYKGDYFSLPFDEIKYFEKNLRDNSSIVVCEKEEFTIRKTISEIADELSDTKFFKTHRSCIVNLNKVIRVNYDDGIIYFKDAEVDLLSRSNKKILREKMKELNGNNT